MRTTIEQIKAHKGLIKNGAEPLVCLTAYTMRIAQILDAHCDVLLVGDSMGMVLYGMDSTQGVDLEMIIRHGQAVMRGSARACVIIDMPYGSYEDSPTQALASARRIMNETGASGVKLEGGTAMAAQVQALVAAGIPVIGHVGLLPQTAAENGGFRVRGRDEEAQTQIIADAQAIAAAGAAAIVIEAVVEPVGAAVTQAVAVPVIGIGASPACDGQILVTEDMLGITGDHVPKFVKQYAHVSRDIEAAVEQYASDVRRRAFPGEAQVYKPKKAL
ncbi:MAG: 3-methyl-2-oxobutanoate hydroxymethyltransferase [Bdellovibrionales bacterium]